MLVRNEGKLVGQRQLLQEVWGPAYETESNYLRVYMAGLRRKLEPDAVPAALLHHRAGHGLPLRAMTALYVALAVVCGSGPVLRSGSGDTSCTVTRWRNTQ